MAGTRTAPEIDGSPTFKRISIRLVDANGDFRSDSIDVPNAASNSQIEAAIVAYQALSNASIYEVDVVQVYESVGLVVNAVDASRESADDTIRVLYKSDIHTSQGLYFRAPLNALMLENTERVDLENALLTTAIVAFGLMLNSGTVAWVAAKARFTEHREMNQASSF